MITLKINNVDLSSLINWESLTLEQILTNQVDTLTFEYSKYGSRTYTPTINDEVTLYEGATKIFGGYIMNITEGNLGRPDGVAYQIQAAEYSVKFGGILATKSYASQTIAQIVTDLMSVYGVGFTANNVICSFLVTKIVFNEMYLSDCLKKLADIVKYDWYVDVNKDLHFFPKMTNAAPYSLTDTSGNYINETLSRTIDGTQIVNQVKVRGGEGDGATYTDIITVNGSITKSFKLPYQFSNLVIEVDTGTGYVTKTVGQDFKDDATLFDCLYSYNDSMVKFPVVLNDGNKIRFTGNPKVPIKSIVSNSSSILLYGLKEKIINDPQIVDITIARKRAKAELLAYQYGSNEIVFDTYVSGLKAGMVINLNSAKRAVLDNYIINRITFKTNGPTEFYYSVNAITTNKLQLIDLLQKLTSPAQGTLDDNVIAENINTDMADIDVTEIIRLVVPHLNRSDLTVSETIWKDPLGANVEPTWVLGPYTPTSASDPKRWGLLSNSLKLY